MATNTAKADTNNANPLPAKPIAKLIASNNPPPAATYKAADEKARALGTIEGKGGLARLDLAVFIGESAAAKPAAMFPVSYIPSLLAVFYNAASLKGTGKSKTLSKESLSAYATTYTSYYNVGAKFGKSALELIDKVARENTQPLGRGYKICVALNKKSCKELPDIEDMRKIAGATTSSTLAETLTARATTLDTLVENQRKVSKDDFDEAKHWPKACVDAAEAFAKVLRAEAKKL